MDQPKGFFGSLFDFTFTDFVTTKMIKLLYIILIIAIGIGTLVAIVGCFTTCGGGWGLLSLLILGPIGFLVGVICIRIYLEIVIVIFRIAESTTEIARSHREKSSSPSPETEL